MGVLGGGGNKCPGCTKTVYQNEEIVACNGRWHKGCLKCGECKITLTIKTVQSHRNKPYSDVQNRHAPKQTFVAPEPAASITYDTPDEQFSGLSVSDQGGYDQGGYEEGGY